MIISDSKEFIFIHNPKCAGTTMRNALRHHETTGDLFFNHATIRRKMVDKAHMPLYVVRDNFPDHFKLFSSYIVFMFVRNPYARTVSAFNELHPDLWKKLVDEEASADSVKLYRATINPFIKGLRNWHINGWDWDHRHLVRQRDMAFIGKKCYVDLTMKIEEWPGCSERLAAFNPEIRDFLLTAVARNIKKLPADPISYLDRWSLDRINALYRDDFLIYDYPLMNPATIKVPEDG
jgi:hypothetical protein